MRNSGVWKWTRTILIIVFIFVSIYVIIGYAVGPEILRAYLVVKSGTKSGLSKKLMFVESYTKTTQDLTLAQSLGFSREDAEDMAKGSVINNTITSNYKELDSLSLQEQVSKLSDPSSGFNYTYYANYLKVVTVDGHDYVYDEQNGTGAWTNYNPGGVTGAMSVYGCFYYSMAALIGAMEGKVYTLENLISDHGYDVSIDESGMFVVSGSPKKDTCGIPNVLGDDIGRLQNALNVAGLNCTASSVTAIDSNKLANGSMYIIWANEAAGASPKLYTPSSSKGKGMHWTAVVGIDKNGDYIVLCNGARGVTLKPTEFYNLSVIWEVSRNE